MLYGTLYIFNYESKEKRSSYYFIAKYNGVYRFVHLYNELMNCMATHISKTNQIYLKYTGYFSLDEKTNTISIIKNDTPSRF